MTIEELFASGAQHTVESLAARGEFGYRDVAAALERRFGAAGVSDPSAVANLIDQTHRAAAASEALQTQQGASTSEYGVNPSLVEQYQYTVIASLPAAPGSEEIISVPWTINSAVPLSYFEILDEASEQLNQGVDRSEVGSGNPRRAENADLLRRDLAIRRQVDDSYGGEAPFDIQVIASYKRS